MARRKVTLHKNIELEKSTILSKRMIATTVMELKNALKYRDKYIEESSKMASVTVMDS